MADLPESTAFDPDAGLRESFLYQFADAERAVLVSVVSCILDLAREGRCIDEGPLPWIWSKIRGIAQDLRFNESVLRYVSSYEEEASDSLWHARLLVLANDLSPKVGRIASELEDLLLEVVGEAREE